MAPEPGNIFSQDDEAQLLILLRMIVPFCGAFGRAKLRSICRAWRDEVDAASPAYTLPRASALQPRGLLASRPLLTSLTLTPTHLQQRPDLYLLESHLTSLTVRSNMRGAAWQRSGQGAVLLLLARLAPLRRLQHLALSDCLMADRWDHLAALRRLRYLDVGGVLEVDNRLLTVLPLLSRLQALTLPGPEGYSPRYNHCSAHGFLLCLHHLKSLSPSTAAAAAAAAAPAAPSAAAAASLRRSSVMQISASCGNLVRMAAVAEAADPDPEPGPQPPVRARPLEWSSSTRGLGTDPRVTATPTLGGLTRLEFRGLPYRRHGPEALRHSRPCPLTEGAVVAALVESLPGLQALSLEEVGGTAGHVVKATAGSSLRGHVPPPGPCAAAAATATAAGLPHDGLTSLGRPMGPRRDGPGGEGGGCCRCGEGGTAAAAAAGANPPEESSAAAGAGCPLLQQSLHFEALSRLTRLTSLTVSSHVQLEYRDGGTRAPTGGSATAPLCDGLLVRWLQPAAAAAAATGATAPSAPKPYPTGDVTSDDEPSTITSATAATTAGSGRPPVPIGVQPSPWRALRELALREVWELGPAGLAAVCGGGGGGGGGGALPALRSLDLTGSGRGLQLTEAVASLERLTGLQRLRLARATCCAWCLPDPFGGRLLEEDECGRSVSEPVLSGSCADWDTAAAAAAAVRAGGRRDSGVAAVVGVLRQGQLDDGGGGGDGRSNGAGGGGGSSRLRLDALVSEEFYQDVDWDAFEDAQHSSVVDLDDGGNDPWVSSRPGSAVLQLQSGSSRQQQQQPGAPERPSRMACSVRALAAECLGIPGGADPPPSLTGPAAAVGAGRGAGAGGGLRSAAAEVLRYHHQHQQPSPHPPLIPHPSPSPTSCPHPHQPHPHAHPHHPQRSLDYGYSYRGGRRSADFFQIARASTPQHPQHHPQHHLRRQPPQRRPSQQHHRASMDAGLQPCGGGRARDPAGVCDDPWVSRRGPPPHRAVAAPRSVPQRLIASHQNWMANARSLVSGSSYSGPGKLTGEAEAVEEVEVAEAEVAEAESRRDDGAGCEVAEAVRRLVTAMPDLQELDLGGWPVTAGVVRQLAVDAGTAAGEVAAAAPSVAAAAGPRVGLQRLGLAGCRLDVTLTEALRGLRDLQYLDISSTRPEAAFLAALASLPSLEEVEVRGCRLLYDSGKALQQLSAVKAVRGLADTTGLGLNGEHVLL